MVKYKFSLSVKGFEQEYTYILDLLPQEENNPEQVFNEQLREKLRIDMQNQSLCAIKDSHLNQIIKTWIQDIKEGFRNSNITLNLPLLIEANIEQLDEQGNQEIPTIITPNLLDIEPQLGMLPTLNFC
ncbi:hypothetical protein [Umezakia ovalisporum]|jgi:hypothetical protein|uniref:Uncharacterized protein n=2 Tax=Umezakia ovalisporum TaxID=75695 RepID=A0AA43H0R1_9CYAN|nr:hypothetical protein [Umezakia ovalisporum]MBI1241406.1 hypothetical protein [Nostoc sp. RI_552]MDH6057160.1 hypothetical protein [Umezakia ovalisporum FSS-43]MDH6064608.1 hypothetical protein [Umezakia ovalisporum FSS-62]MDH6069010.1 hypothetical protein [Umezakia ovalisporum APH033B]MDH6071700.1 hypothetical protein [Umezakia ovalisporum CobakiLakeA]